LRAYESRRGDCSNVHFGAARRTGDLLFPSLLHAPHGGGSGQFAFDECCQGDRRSDGASPPRCPSANTGAEIARRMRRNRLVGLSRPPSDANSVGSSHLASHSPPSASCVVSACIDAWSRGEKIQAGPPSSFDWRSSSRLRKIRRRDRGGPVELAESGTAELIEEESSATCLFACPTCHVTSDRTPKPLLRKATSKFDKRVRQVEKPSAMAGRPPPGDNSTRWKTEWLRAKRGAFSRAPRDALPSVDAPLQTAHIPRARP